MTATLELSAGTATIAASELVDRLRCHGLHVSHATVADFLRDFARQGIAERDDSGRWRLTPAGLRCFGSLAEIEGRP